MSNFKDMYGSWKTFLAEAPEEINEVSEEELEDIEGIVQDLKPEDLSFNNIFGDRMRIVTPMQTQDRDLEALRKLLQGSGYEPDFATGLATYHVLAIPPGKTTPAKTTVMSPEQLEMWSTSAAAEGASKFIRKKQIKIGKLLQKGSRLYDIAKKSYRQYAETERDMRMSYTAPDADEATLQQKTEDARHMARQDMDKLEASFPALTSTPTGENLLQYLASWWNRKSTYYRENPEAAGPDASTGEYSIIYTRHPIDVLRMSDFENIQSCHSPSSRGGGASYYKCAVAEAHGTGFVAYAVKNEDLLNLLYADTETQEEAKDLQGLLDLYQEDDKEFFIDDHRSEGDIHPVARLRVKKYTNPPLDVTLAVPEGRVYQAGASQSGRHGVVSRDAFINNVVKWAQAEQADTIKQILATYPDDEGPHDAESSAFNSEGFLELGNWQRHGGTYQDTPDGDLFWRLLQRKTVGRAQIDSSTEDNLEVHANLIERWQTEVNEIQERYNHRMDMITVQGTAEDDGANEAYIEVAATLRLIFDEDDFLVSAFQDQTRKAIDYLPEYLIDYGITWLKDYATYTTMNPRSHEWAELIRAAADEAESKVVVEIGLDLELINPNGAGYAFSPDDFEDLCSNIDDKDNEAQGILDLATGYLKREGILKGGAMYQLAGALQDESWYEWSHEIDDEWEPTEITIETATYVNVDDIIKQIPIKFDTELKSPTETFIASFDGSPIAGVVPKFDGKKLVGYTVHSTEFLPSPTTTAEEMDVSSKEAALEWIQWNVARMIMGPSLPGSRASHSYSSQVRKLMRDEVPGAKEGEFMYPNTEMEVKGPDSDDEYRMEFRIYVNDDTPDEASENAMKIISETDDEDLLKGIFKKALAIVAKVPHTNLDEVHSYFNKFDFS
jgi:hypothetical protein